ncbi:kinetochore protein NDC80 homolog [Nicotiana sylvestris]|uniref:Kinetochore protein NDC80 n=1 Tax=Nicotiana sylvestris TaxID=4096 RepID=A0A1U7XK83_NICSY|nr:PREDICTED: probable kinetochore protein NDC80 isoform X1 [Nicotiana sylvestris]
MRGAGRRPTNSVAPDWRHPPPTPTATKANDPRQFIATGGRDSDASFASSRPSSVGVNPRSAAIPISDRSYQLNAIRTINAYLSSHSLPFTLKPPLPSAKDITETLKFILSRFGLNPSESQKLDDDLQTLLKSLNCPVKVNKSALRAPGTPHSWPSLLAAIHWLVQLGKFDDHRLSTRAQQLASENKVFRYTVENYSHYIRGEDKDADDLDSQFMLELEQEKARLVADVNASEENLKAQEAKLEALKNGPSEREVLENEKSALEEDVKKFHSIIEQLQGRITTVERSLEEQVKGLETKVAEKESIYAENEELKKKVEEQGINPRDADRMKRELHALERDIADIENQRIEWEEKGWDLDSAIGNMYKKLEELMIECNQSIRRLKLGNEFQYNLNAQGSSEAEVLGIDYKTTLKPMLASFEDEMKKSSMMKMEELITLQQQSVEKASKIESKRNRLTTLQAHIDNLEAQLDLLKKEKQDYISRCAAEARRMAEEVETETRKSDLVEREAADFLKASNAKLQEIIAQTEEEVQTCALELFAVVDTVSKYKEFVTSKIATMKNALAETAGAVADMHKAGLPGSVASR